MKMHVFHWLIQPWHLPMDDDHVLRRPTHDFLLLSDDGGWTWGNCVFIKDNEVIQVQDTSERIWDVASYHSYNDEDWDTPSADEVLRVNGVDPHDQQSFI